MAKGNADGARRRRLSGQRDLPALASPTVSEPAPRLRRNKRPQVATSQDRLLVAKLDPAQVLRSVGRRIVSRPPEKRGKIIRHLEEAMAIADGLEDGATSSGSDEQMWWSKRLRSVKSRSPRHRDPACRFPLRQDRGTTTHLIATITKPKRRADVARSLDAYWPLREPINIADLVAEARAADWDFTNWCCASGYDASDLDARRMFEWLLAYARREGRAGLH